MTRLDFDAEDHSWSVSANGQDPVKFMTFVDDTHVNMILPDGSYELVELSNNGLMAYRQAAGAAALAAR